MEKFKKLFLQFFKFSIVGFICFLLDYVLLVLFKEVFNLSVLLSNAIAFTSSTVLNYILNMRFVFVSKDGSKVLEITIYVVLSLIGLIINEAIMFLGVKFIPIHYLAIKIIATAVVTVYNFITRKIFIEKH